MELGFPYSEIPIETCALYLTFPTNSVLYNYIANSYLVTLYVRSGIMEEQVLISIDKKLNAVVRLLASKSIEKKTKTEAIMTLAALGLDANLISKIVDTTPGTVYARLAEAKKKSRTATAKSKKKVESNE